MEDRRRKDKSLQNSEVRKLTLIAWKDSETKMLHQWGKMASNTS